MKDKYIKISYRLWHILRYQAVKEDKTIKSLAGEYIETGLKRVKKVRELFTAPKKPII